MHSKLNEAFNLLEFAAFPILNEDGSKVTDVSKSQHIEALFSYFNLAAYLSDSLLDKTVDYLHLEKAFAADIEQVKKDLKQATALAKQSGKFDPEIFCDNFARQEYFTVADIIDLIDFLQQTAFDRQFGQERDRLQGKVWMEAQSAEFLALANMLGVVAPLPPLFQHYCGMGIMGAASIRIGERIRYFSKLNANAKEEKISFDSIWALTGNRELSKGLDEAAVVEAVAKYYNKPLQYIIKAVGKDTREFADGITETMMLKYLVQTNLPANKINLLDSETQKEHWRVTTQQNAADIAPRVLDLLEKNPAHAGPANQVYYFMIIAEQPYAGRMARQVQRAFDVELKKRNQGIYVRVEGCGAAITDSSIDTLSRLNSELAALGAERFTDARIKLKNLDARELRDPKIIMFSSRDDFYLQLKNKKQASQEGDIATDNLVSLSIFSDTDDKFKFSIEPETLNKPPKKPLS